MDSTSDGPGVVGVRLDDIRAGGDVIIRDVHVQVDAVPRDERFQRNRAAMLEKVRLIWITGFLEQSLDRRARIELGLESRPEAVTRPFDLLVQGPRQAPQPMPSGTAVSAVFDAAGKGLLILGAPGAGKTTLLLELTRELLERAEQDAHHRLPVVFHLASWAEQRLPLSDWLVDELHKRYDLHPKLARQWVDAGRILPLLDGLDEVAAAHREACVAALNGFIQHNGLMPLAVGSRVADYQALAERLRLPGAVLIRPLSRPEVDAYLDQAGMALAGVRTVLQHDAALWELLDNPLMLSILVLAYRDRPAEAIRLAGTIEAHRRQLFEAYTEAMFQRGTPNPPYARAQTEHWLSWLARTLRTHSQSVLYLEWMQPNWLPARHQQRQFTVLTVVLSGLVCGVLGGLLVGLLGGLRFGGRTCFQHLALRLLLWRHDFAPLNYVRFLDYAAQRILLRQVGGGYAFVHRMLLEYYADRNARA